MMSNKRVIARLDIKGEKLIKGINLEGLRVVGDPHEFCLNYYENGADEIILMDAVASLYGRNGLTGVIESASESVFVPIIVGGGIRTLEDAQKMFEAGADKIAINTGAVKNPSLIPELLKVYGSQALVLSVEAKMSPVTRSGWEVYTDNGREKTGLDVIDWCTSAVDSGIGEVLLTSVDKEGMSMGFDLPLCEVLSKHLSVPVLASGGFGHAQHAIDLFQRTEVAGMAIARSLHYGKTTIDAVKKRLACSGIATRYH